MLLILLQRITYPSFFLLVNVKSNQLIVKINVKLWRWLIEVLRGIYRRLPWLPETE